MKKMFVIKTVIVLLIAQNALSALGPVDKNPENPTFTCQAQNGDQLSISNSYGNAAEVKLTKSGELKIYKTGYTSTASLNYAKYAYAFFQPNFVEVASHSSVGRGCGRGSCDGGFLNQKMIFADVKIGDYENTFNCN
ncbi:MAG: hypothetical protein A2622_06415 [Bdellovibrionales bacterium RIFCSPHIGHO2_01_FULL_40_29]|nr:MAG: hypothetical protein A2622_06415 [Bdellovibrionales bacterium RIFCSPHIGHO2_01_FULL_40_29]OFZ35077.1 MAG: hypothetical protein A3D17_06765 [Bdellovibrionales bacterium RIFCSPHIGHO2_02_FULL_40_15]